MSALRTRFSFYSGSEGYIQAALFKEEPSDDFFPLFSRKIKGEKVWFKLVFTLGAFPFPIKKYVSFFGPAFWA